MSVAEYARATGLARRTVYDRVDAGKIAHTRINNRLYITEPVTNAQRPHQPDLPEGQWSVEAYAAACGVSNTTVYRWIDNGRVKRTTVEGMVVVTSAPIHPVRGGAPERGMTARRFAEAAEVNAAKVYDWIRTGKVHAEKVDGRWVVFTRPEDAPSRSVQRASPKDPFIPRGHQTVEQYARARGVDENTVRRWIQDGTVPTLVVGRRRFIPDGAAPRHHSPNIHQGLTLTAYARTVGAVPATVRGWVERGLVDAVEVNDRTYITSAPDPSLKGAPRPLPEGSMSTDQFAAACGVGPDRVRQWARQGVIDTVWVDRRMAILTDPAQMKFPEGWLTVPAFAAAAGVKPHAVYAWRKAGKLRAQRVRGKWVIGSDPAQFRQD